MKLFSFPPGYRKDSWLKVQRQSRNGSRKGSTEGNQIHKSRKGSGGEFRRVLQPGGESTMIVQRYYDLSGQRKCKKGAKLAFAVEIGRVDATSHSIF